MRRFNCCNLSSASIVQFLTFLQFSFGYSIILYSAWLLYHWEHPHLTSNLKLPAPWFMLDFMWVGNLVCCIALLGWIAAETINVCHLCFYTLLIAVLFLREAALVVFIATDRQWQEDLPVDPTGQIESLRFFFEENRVICRWVCIIVLVIQALSLLVALVLRATVSTRREEFDDDEENPQSGKTSGSCKGDIRGNHPDVWSSQMREKHGLNNGDRHSYEV